MIVLSPFQESVYDQILMALQSATNVGFFCRAGMGSTTILQALRETLGPTEPFINVSSFLEATVNRNPLSLAETTMRVQEDALERTQQYLFNDDGISLGNFAASDMSLRPYYAYELYSVFHNIARNGKKKIVTAAKFGFEDHPDQGNVYALRLEKKDFGVDDYAFFIRLFG